MDVLSQQIHQQFVIQGVKVLGQVYQYCTGIALLCIPFHFLNCLLDGTQRNYMAGATRSYYEQEINFQACTDHTLRIGFLIDHYLQAAGQAPGMVGLNQCLKTWTNRKDIARRRFLSEYQSYLQYAGPFSSIAQELCSMVDQTVLQLQHSQLVETIQKLTFFYRQYYEILDRKQSDTLSVAGANNELFSLCCKLIEAYQTQKTIRESCSNRPNTPADSVAVKEPVIRSLFSESSRSITNPGKLFQDIKCAFEAMSSNKKTPFLWYRGQKNIEWKTLPNIMRENVPNKDTFLPLFKKEIILARSNILPVGADFTMPDWLAFLQHNEFKTSVLDFSESLFPAFYFAIEDWIYSSVQPDNDAVVIMFNPVLFNLAMEALEQFEAHNGNKEEANNWMTDRLKHYLVNGECDDSSASEPPLFAQLEIESEHKYSHLFDWTLDSSSLPKHNIYPRAALIPKNCERMKNQSGQFVFFNLYSQKQGQDGAETPPSYDWLSLESLQNKFHSLFISGSEEEQKLYRPFMTKLIFDHNCYKDFVLYMRAIGISRYQMYPEYHNLAKDICKQLGIRENNS